MGTINEFHFYVNSRQISFKRNYLITEFKILKENSDRIIIYNFLDELSMLINA